MSDAATTLRTFASNFEGFHIGLLAFCALAGVYLSASSLWKFATWHRRERAGESPIAALYAGLGGAVLLSLGEIVRRQSETMFDAADPRSILDYASPSGNEAQMLATVLLGVMTLFGWIGIATGWLIFSRLGKTSGGDRHGDFKNMVVFCAAGTIAANLLVFTDVVCATFGWDNYLRQILGQ